jgi:hypothetical protein
MRRRDFLPCAGAAIGQHALASILPQGVHAVRSAMAPRPDIRLRIENSSPDIGNRVHHQDNRLQRAGAGANAALNRRRTCLDRSDECHIERRPRSLAWTSHRFTQ